MPFPCAPDRRPAGGRAPLPHVHGVRGAGVRAVHAEARPGRYGVDVTLALTTLAWAARRYQPGSEGTTSRSHADVRRARYALLSAPRQVVVVAGRRAGAACRRRGLRPAAPGTAGSGPASAHANASPAKAGPGWPRAAARVPVRVPGVPAVPVVPAALRLGRHHQRVDRAPCQPGRGLMAWPAHALLEDIYWPGPARVICTAWRRAAVFYLPTGTHTCRATLPQGVASPMTPAAPAPRPARLFARCVSQGASTLASFTTLLD